MTRGYHLVEARETECCVCGEVRICAVMQADLPESETGYIDEFAICGECERKAAK